MNPAVADRVWELAADVGRLRRRLEAESSLGFLAGRIANHVDAINSMVRPTAAQIARSWAPGDNTAVDEAIRLVEEHSDRLQKRLGRAA